MSTFFSFSKRYHQLTEQEKQAGLDADNQRLSEEMEWSKLRNELIKKHKKAIDECVKKKIKIESSMIDDEYNKSLSLRHCLYKIIKM